MRACVNLNDTLTDPEFAFSTSASHSPFVRTHGTSLFGYYDTVRDFFLLILNYCISV